MVLPRPPRGRRDSLTTRLMVFIFVATLVTAVAVSWTAVQSSYVLLRQQYEASDTRLLEAGADALHRTLLGAIRERAADPELARVLATGARGQGALASPDRACAEPAGIPFEPLVLRDALGAERARRGPGAAKEGPGEPAPTEPRLQILDGALVAAAPVLGADGAVLGSLHGSVALERAGALLGPGGCGDAMLALVDPEGRVRATSPDAHLAPGERIPADLLADADSPFGVFRSAADVPMLAGHHPLDAAGGWRLLVARPAESAFASVFGTVGRVVALDLAIVLLFSLLAYRVTVAVVRPLEALAEGARRITQGEYQVELPEPEVHDEIGLVTRTFNDMARRLRGHRTELEAQHRELSERNTELQRANEVLEQLSITDSLTKLHNHRYFQEALTRELKRVSRTRDPLSMLLIDIDDFKQWNDRYGHAAGDSVLRQIAMILNDSVRESDVLARYGGEEFVVLATGTDLAGARFLAEKLRTRVAEARFEGPADGEGRVTISVGVALYHSNRGDLFVEADRALYRAKAEGKNCAVVADAAG